MKRLGTVLAAFGILLAYPGSRLARLGLYLVGNQPAQDTLRNVTIHEPDEETIERLSALAELGAVGFRDPRSEWRLQN